MEREFKPASEYGRQDAEERLETVARLLGRPFKRTGEPEFAGDWVQYGDNTQILHCKRLKSSR